MPLEPLLQALESTAQRFARRQAVNVVISLRLESNGTSRREAAARRGWTGPGRSGGQSPATRPRWDRQPRPRHRRPGWRRCRVPHPRRVRAAMTGRAAPRTSLPRCQVEPAVQSDGRSDGHPVLGQGAGLVRVSMTVTTQVSTAGSSGSVHCAGPCAGRRWRARTSARPAAPPGRSPPQSRWR